MRMSTPITHQPGYEAYKRSIFFPYEAAIAIKTDDTENIHRWFEFSKPQDHDINQCHMMFFVIPIYNSEGSVKF